MSEFLPQHPGGSLPYFLLLTSSLAFVHAAVCYLAPASTALKQFQGLAAPPPHALLARVYGVKNLYTTLIRAYAAYHITNRALYDLAVFTYVGALGFYATEVFYYRTTRVREAASTFVLTFSAIVWMLSQRDYYTGGDSVGI